MPNPLPAIFYQGLFNRDDDENSCDPAHGLEDLNIDFIEKAAGTRYGADLLLGPISEGWNGIVKRIHVYERVGEASRLLILNNQNKIWDSTDLTNPILDFSGTVNDFALQVMYNRAYISPHNGETGVTGEKVYVYEGSGSARAAAGLPPSGYTLVAASSTAGKIEVGHHLFTVAYETSSGFITAPGMATGVGSGEVLDHNSQGAKTLHITGIPTSTGKKRYILATQVLSSVYNGNPAEQTWFFVPGGYINDDSTTAWDVSFYDADLLLSADYLQYQKSTIPAGVALGDFNDRLIVLGDPLNSSKPWVSTKGYPESFSDLDGYIIVNPGDAGGGCKNMATNRGQLFLFKSRRTYTLIDNGAAPSTWLPERVDVVIGAECHSIGRIFNAPGSSEDDLYVGDRTGIYLFPQISDRPLTWKIHELWQTINPAAFNTVQISVDPVDHHIYANVPLGSATEPDYLIVGNFKNGLDPDNIRWSKWQYPKKPTSIWLDLDHTTQRPNFRFGSSEGSIYKETTSRTDFDGASTINSFIQFGYYPDDSVGTIVQATELRFRVKGSGTLGLTVRTLGGGTVISPPGLALSSESGMELTRLINIFSERIGLKVQTNNGTDWFQMYSLRINAEPLWFQRPQV